MLFKLTLAIAITLALLSTVQCSKVHDFAIVSPEDFTATVRNGDPWFIEFFAPWCTHCQQLAPAWEELAEKADGAFKVGKIDCTLNSRVCGLQLVGSYPTLVYYKGKEKFKYGGDRSAMSMLKWALNGPTADEIQPEVEEEMSDVEELTDETFEVVEKKGVWFVAFYAPWCAHCQKLLPLLDKLSLVSKEYKVAQIDASKERKTADKYKIRSMPTLKLFKDGQVFDYNAGRSVASFDKFITDKIHEKEFDERRDFVFSGESRVVVLTDKNFESVTAGKDFFVKFYAPWCGHCTRLAPVWDDLSTDTRFNIGKVDCTQETELKFNNLIGGYPTLILFKANGETVRYAEPRNKVNFIKFLTEHMTPNYTAKVGESETVQAATKESEPASDPAVEGSCSSPKDEETQN